MRNLKKILALVLALVMSMSLVTIANAADFTDNDDISYEEAADVMSAIGIIEGFEDGSFDPDGTLTREQAAMLVARMLLGTNADRLGIEDSTFNDVAVTRWSAPAIEYCVSLGLIYGAGDGNFYPAGQLTGYAFAKILLTAIGYSSEKEGLVGSSWSVNTAALAMDVGLDSGLENGISSTVLSREEAAQMALNAIKTPLVAYDNDATITVNGAEVSIGSGDAYYITTTLAREQRISEEQLTNSNDYTVEFGERYFPNLRLIREADEFERPSHTWVYEGEEIGSYIDYDLRVADYTEAITGRDLYDLLGKSTIQDYEITYYVDGAANDNIKASNMIRSNTVSYAETGNGVLTEVFVDHTNEEVTITSVNTYLAQANADYNETRGELSLTVYQNNATGTGKTIEVEDIADITEYKEGDFVLVNMAASGTTGDKMEVVRINDVDSMVDCTVTGYSKNKNVTVDGEDYDYAEKAFYDDGVLDEYNQGYLDNYTYTFYMDQYGYVIGAEIYEGEANYVFVTGYDMNGSNLSISNATAGAIFLDGRFEEIQVSVSRTNDNIDTYNTGKASGRTYAKFGYNVNGGEFGESEYNKWFRYTVNESGVYTLKPVEYWVEEMAEPNGDEVNSATIRVGSGTERAYGNDDSVYITVDTGAVDYTTHMGITKVNGTYTGVQSVDLKVLAYDDNALDSKLSVFALYENNDDGRYIIGAVIVGEDMNNTKNYAYILDNDAQREYEDANDDDFWDVQAVVDGEIVTLTVADYEGAIDAIKNTMGNRNGRMYRVTYNANGHVIEAEACADKAFDNRLNDYVYGSTPWNSTTTGVGTDYINRDIEPDYDKIYLVNVTTDQALFIGGNTLYIGNAQDYGLALASAPIIVVQDVVDQAGNVVRQSEEVYSSVSQALDTLKDKNAFEGWISAVLNDNGTAAYLVIDSDDPVSITTDDGSVGARGNVNTFHDNNGTGTYTYNTNGTGANELVLRGSYADAAFAMNQYGMLTTTINYTAPQWVPDGATVTLGNVDLMYYGAKVEDLASRTATIRNGKATFTWTSSFGTYFGFDATGFSIAPFTANTDEVFSLVNVYYFDETGADISDMMDTVVTDHVLAVGGSTLNIRMPNSALSTDTVNARFWNLRNSTPASTTYGTLNGATGWNLTSNRGANGMGPAIVELSVSGMESLYRVTSIPATTLGTQYSGTPTEFAGLTLTVNLSRTTGIQAGGTVLVTGATIDTPIGAASDVGMKVTLSNGTELYFANTASPSAKIENGSFIVDSDMTLRVTRVEEVAAPTITNVEYNDVNGANGWDAGDTIVVHFSDKLGANPGQAGSEGAKLPGVVATDGMSIKYTVGAGQTLTTGGTFTLTGFSSAETGVVQNGTYTITFGSNDTNTAQPTFAPAP